MTTLLKPRLPQMMVMDGLTDADVFFDVYGGNQWNGYNVLIVNKENPEDRRQFSVNTYSNKITITANDDDRKLLNGNDYLLYVQIRIDETYYSSYSDPMLIKVYRKPVCSLSNLTGVGDSYYVYNQNYLFTGVYQQSERVRLNSYYFILYNSEKQVIKQFDTVYVPVGDDSHVIRQNIEGFEPNTTYHLELVCIDENDLQCSTGIIKFIVDYAIPRIKQKLDLENDKNTASVKISSNMIQIIFKSQKDPVYVNGQQIDLRDNKIWIDEQIHLVSNFTIELYCSAIPRTMLIPEETYIAANEELGRRIQAMYDYIDYEREIFRTSTPKERLKELNNHKSRISEQKEIVRREHERFISQQEGFIERPTSGYEYPQRPNVHYFCEIYSVDKTCEIKMYEHENRIYVVKIIHPIQSGEDIVGVYCSDIIDNYVPNETPLKIQVNHIDKRVEIYVAIDNRVV